MQRALAADPPRAPSLIITVWGDAIAPHGGAVLLAGLIRLLAPFGINERLVRTSVFRLAREAGSRRRRHGRASLYRLTRDGARRFDDAYRRIYAPPRRGLGRRLGARAGRRLATPRSGAALATSSRGRASARSGLRRSCVPREAAPRAAAIAAATRRRDQDIVVARASDLPGAAAAGARVRRARGIWPRSPRDYRRFLRRFGAVIERFRAATASTIPRSASSCARC